MSESFGLDEEEMMEAVADALTTDGFNAFVQDTGGGTLCIVLERKGGGEIAWGTANVSWCATVIDGDGEIIGSIETACPSESESLDEVVSAIRQASASSSVKST
jgi:hypothetical protein